MDDFDVKAEILQCLYKKAYCNNTLTRFYNMSSNVAAGWLFGIPIRGTHSHAFVSSFMVSGNISDTRELFGFLLCTNLEVSFMRKDVYIQIDT